jgi:hypothetical protein
VAPLGNRRLDVYMLRSSLMARSHDDAHRREASFHFFIPIIPL